MLHFQRISKFAVVGVCATAIHIVIAATLIETSVFNPGGANSVAFVVATSFSYLLNTRWSFAAPFSRRNAQRFIVTAVLGCALAYTLSSIVDYYGGHYLLGIALVVAVVPAFSYLMHTVWTYRADSAD